MATDRICVLGHSGIGKSPLSALFVGDRFEPRRKRKPKTPSDYVISDTDFTAERQKYQPANALHHGIDPGGDWELEVHPDVSFLEARGKDQFLEYRTPAPSSVLRIEIYAPILVDCLKNLPKLPSDLTQRLDPQRALFLLLNPAETSFARMSAPTSELEIAVFAANAERAKAQGKVLDLPDVLGRIRSLKTELPAWQSLLANSSITTAECLSWWHFEYCYFLPTGNLVDAIRELRRARQTVLGALQTKVSSVVADVESMMLTDDHLARLAEII